MISVLLPFRDAADTFSEAVESVRAQRGVAFEIIAIDDNERPQGGGTIATGGIGIAGALCAGLRAARGEFVARMDADDVCLPDRLARQLEALREHPDWGVVGTRVEAFGSVGEGLRRYVEWQNALVSPEDHARQLFVESPLCHPSVMLRREALEAAGGWRETAGPEDYDLWLRLDAAGWKLAKVPEALLRWRHRAGRATFADPRYALERFRETKAPYLARRLAAAVRSLNGDRIYPCNIAPRLRNFRPFTVAQRDRPHADSW